MDDPHYLLQGGKRERRVCCVIHTLTLFHSLVFFPPPLCLLSKPSDYKVFFGPVLVFAGELPNLWLVIVLVSPAPCSFYRGAGLSG